MKFTFALALVSALAFGCARTHQKTDAAGDAPAPAPQAPAAPMAPTVAGEKAGDSTVSKVEVAVGDQQKGPQIYINSASFKNRIDRENALKNVSDPINQVLGLRTLGALRAFSIPAATSLASVRLADADGKSTLWLMTFTTVTKEDSAKLWSQLDKGGIAIKCETATINVAKSMIKCSEFKVSKKSI